MEKITVCDHFQTQVLHLARMARHPGFLDHARFRAKQLANDPSGLWDGILEAIATELRRTADPTSTKPGSVPKRSDSA